MPTPSLPRSLADLLIVFRPCFTAPTFATFRDVLGLFPDALLTQLDPAA